LSSCVRPLCTSGEIPVKILKKVHCRGNRLDKIFSGQIAPQHSLPLATSLNCWQICQSHPIASSSFPAWIVLKILFER